MLKSPAEAEDAVQNAFLRAWCSSASCRTPEAPLPWLLQITRNEALRLLGQNGRAEVPEELAAEPAEDDPEVTTIPDKVDIRRVLEALSPEDRRLLELRYTDDLTQPAVAAALGVPEGTVKVRLHRLRSRLRLALEGQI